MTQQFLLYMPKDTQSQPSAIATLSYSLNTVELTSTQDLHIQLLVSLNGFQMAQV